MTLYILGFHPQPHSIRLIYSHHFPNAPRPTRTTCYYRRLLSFAVEKTHMLSRPFVCPSCWNLLASRARRPPSLTPINLDAPTTSPTQLFIHRRRNGVLPNLLILLTAATSQQPPLSSKPRKLEKSSWISNPSSNQKSNTSQNLVGVWWGRWSWSGTSSSIVR